MPNKKVAIILVYFGKLPNYFQIWLDSAGNNHLFDFFIFTDCSKDRYSLYANIKWINTNFNNLKKLVSKLLPYKISLETPYKLCDYKPLYGLIFQSFLSGYDFWGHCDPDIVWGNLSSYINCDLLNKYDKIYNRGHLILYRNNYNINTLVLKDIPKASLNSKYVFQTKYNAHFDESRLLEKYLKKSNIKEYKNVDCADVDYMYLDFRIVNSNLKRDCYQYFIYKKGSLYGMNHNTERQFAYIHLQKRQMDLKDVKFDKPIYIYPNKFSNDIKNFKKLSNKEMDKYNKIKRKELLVRRLNNIKKGALVFRFKKFQDKINNQD